MRDQLGKRQRAFFECQERPSHALINSDSKSWFHISLWSKNVLLVFDMNQLPFAPAIRMTLKRKGLKNNSFNKNCQQPNLTNPFLTKKGVISFLLHSLPANTNPFLTRKRVISFLAPIGHFFNCHPNFCSR